MNMRMLVELATVGMQGAKDTDFESKATSMFEHGSGGTAKESIEQRPVVVEKRPKQVRHGEGNVLPFAIRQNMPLLGNPLFGAFHPASTAGFRFTALAEKAGMRAIRRLTAITANTHRAGAAGEHFFDAENLPFIDGVVIDEVIPSVIVLE